MTQVGEVLQLKTETSLPVKIDDSQFVKVIDNLVLNAKEALAASPSVSHGDQSWIKVKAFRRGKYAVLEVSDNGSGMTREFQEKRLFQPFQTTKKQGMGIGLYQSRMIVEKHGGRIEVDSVEDQGSTFRVLLPIVTSPTSLKAN
jgi:hypothetical protein